MPDPCDYDSEDEFHSDCVVARQSENPDESIEQSNAACYSIWDNRECDKRMNDKTVFKVGEQSGTDPFEFVMSTDREDRHGDIVEQKWKLTNFKRNPIALWNHNSGQPIGFWKNVRVSSGRLMGRLQLAEKGTSELIDTLRSMIEQRILKAVSVGFRPGKVEALDEEKPWNGYRLTDNELFECSLCSVPANPETLSVAKALQGKSIPEMIRETADDIGKASAYKQLGSPRPRDSGEEKTGDVIEPGSAEPKPIHRTAKMPLSDKIERKQQQVEDLRNQMTEIDKDYDGDEDMPAEVVEQYEDLSQRLTKAQDDLDTLMKAESAMKLRASQQTQDKDPDAGKRLKVGMVTARKERPKGYNAIRTIATMVKAFGEHASPAAIAKASLQDEPEIELLVKAATDPATMTDAAWAAPLVRETWGEFIELLRAMSVYPAVPGARVEFDRFGKINVPRNNGRGQLAGGWVGELSPIPVKEGAYDTVDLQPKKLGVITSYSKEIGMHSIPAIQGLLQTQLLEDTAVQLDSSYLDNGARTTLRPAGLQDPTETGAANINAATGATVAAILADLKGMISRMIEAYSGNTAVWLINPLNILSLSVLQDAASGAFVFKDEIMAGTLMGYPFISSQNVPVDTIYLHSDQAMMHGNDYAPNIAVSSETTLVFDDTAPNNIDPNVEGHPAKSMFQVDGIAIKLTLGLDWRIVRTGGIQVLTGVSW